jgi:hypothetical protein
VKSRPKSREGRRYNRLKKKAGYQAENGCRKKCNIQNPPERTSEKLGKEHGVDARTITEDAKFSRAVDTLPEVKAKIQRGEKVIKKDVIAAAKAQRP